MSAISHDGPNSLHSMHRIIPLFQHNLKLPQIQFTDGFSSPTKTSHTFWRSILWPARCVLLARVSIPACLSTLVLCMHCCTQFSSATTQTTFGTEGRQDCVSINLDIGQSSARTCGRRFVHNFFVPCKVSCKWD